VDFTVTRSIQTIDAPQHTFYRNRITAKHLIPFSVVIKETDLLIFAERPLEEEAIEAVLHYRHHLEEYISTSPDFARSLVPLPPDEYAPPFIRKMLHASRLAQVGPMASVAGALAEQVGNDLLEHTPNVIVENGGDLFLKVSEDLTIGIYAGSSPLSNKLALKIPAAMTPLGVCTSSGTVGHSLSFGRSDAVTILAHSTPLADATATAVGNHVKGTHDIAKGLDYAQTIEGILGTLIIVDDQFGAWGDIEIVPT
jgi:ApbE superfamily uncharacterized protein (UPF0280 family)